MAVSRTARGQSPGTPRAVVVPIAEHRFCLFPVEKWGKRPLIENWPQTALIANLAETRELCPLPSMSRFHGQKPDVIAWPAGEFAVINAARIAGAADNEIRHLVARLETETKECLR